MSADKQEIDNEVDNSPQMSESMSNSNENIKEADEKEEENESSCLITDYFKSFVASAIKEELIDADDGTPEAFYQGMILIDAWKSQRINAGLKTPLNNSNDTAIIFGNMLDLLHRYDVNCHLLLTIFCKKTKTVDATITASKIDWEDYLETFVKRRKNAIPMTIVKQIINQIVLRLESKDKKITKLMLDVVQKIGDEYIDELKDELKNLLKTKVSKRKTITQSNYIEWMHNLIDDAIPLFFNDSDEVVDKVTDKLFAESGPWIPCAPLRLRFDTTQKDQVMEYFAKNTTKHLKKIAHKIKCKKVKVVPDMNYLLGGGDGDSDSDNDNDNT